MKRRPSFTLIELLVVIQDIEQAVLL